MYKYIGLSIICLFAIPAFAEKTCNGGTLVTAHTVATRSRCFDSTRGVDTCNGMTFCKSNRKMPWWSAVLWCKSNNRTLASMEHVCPYWQGVNPEYCENLDGIANGCWINKVGFRYNDYGYIQSTWLNSLHYALCE